MELFAPGQGYWLSKSLKSWQQDKQRDTVRARLHSNHGGTVNVPSEKGKAGTKTFFHSKCTLFWPSGAHSLGLHGGGALLEYRRWKADLRDRTHRRILYGSSSTVGWEHSVIQLSPTLL